MGNWELLQEDVREFAATYQEPQFHALLTDPPYEMNFMGRDWDRSGIAFKPETWAALAKHLLPGAFGMTFASARGWHRVACAIEDAGLRIFPTIFCWAFGSGFPKATRIKGHKEFAGHRYGLQAMKPAIEPIIVWQKPYEGKPVDSIVKHGAGALNIDAARVGLAGMEEHKTSAKSGLGKHGVYGASTVEQIEGKDLVRYDSKGRWPSNFAIGHSTGCRRVGAKKIKNPSGNVSGKEPSKPAKNVYGEYDRCSFERHTDADGLETVETWECVPDCPVRKLDEQSGRRRSGTQTQPLGTGGIFTDKSNTPVSPQYGDSGGASRYFFNSDWNAEVEEGLFTADPVRYCAKAARKERDAGLEEMPAKFWSDGRKDKADHPKQRGKTARHNPHPTVKPIKLCRWLASLLLPPDAYAPRRILIPFAGVGSEMAAAALEGWEVVVGIEMESEYAEIAKTRLGYWLLKERQGKLWPSGE